MFDRARDFGFDHTQMVWGVVLFSVFLGWAVFHMREGSGFRFDAGGGPVVGQHSPDPGIQGLAAADTARELAELRKEQGQLRAAIKALQPRGAYLVVDRANNRIYLRKGDSLVLEAIASTGSGAELRETSGEKRSWTFQTPAGRFSVLGMRSDPVWTKPDWAFVEASEPIPTSLSERREYGTLGEYALDLGDGYMIHGTLYERLLGRSVTHGCVRVGREALREIVRNTRPGQQVFIF